MQIIANDVSIYDKYLVYGAFSGALANAANQSLIAISGQASIHLMGFYIYVLTPCTIILREGAGTNITSIPLIATEKYQINFGFPGLKVATAGNAISIRQESGAAVTVEALAWGYRMSVID